MALNFLVISSPSVYAFYMYIINDMTDEDLYVHERVYMYICYTGYHIMALQIYM